MGLFDSLGPLAALNPMAFLGTGAELGGGLLSYAGAEQQASSARDIANAQMAFQERMSDTAVQRQVADMRAAGINPALAGSYGGASTPAGTSYMPPNVMAPLGDAVSKLGSSAMDAVRLGAELDQTKSQTDLNKANAEKAAQDTATGESLEALNRQKEMSERVSQRLTQAQTEQTGYSARKVLADLPQAEALAAQVRKYPDATGTWDYLMDRLGSAGSALGKAFGGGAAAKYLLSP